MVKETRKNDQERKVQSTCFAHFWPLPLQGHWVPLGIVCLQSLWGITKLQSMAQWLFRGHFHVSFMLFSHRQAHNRVSKIHQKMCLLGEQRTRAPSILTLSWRSQMSSQDERLLLQAVLCWDSWPPEERILIQDQIQGLTAWSFLCSKVFFWALWSLARCLTPLCFNIWAVWS